VPEPSVPLQSLIQQFLLGRTEGLAAPQVAAFVSGWSSALELVRRADLLLPAVTPEFCSTLKRLLDELELAQEVVLADP